MIERIIISVLIPALMMLTIQPLGWNVDQNQPMETSAQASFINMAQAVLMGTQSDENDLITFAVTTPDDIEGGTIFTVTETITAKVDLEGAAIVTSIPDGFALASGGTTSFSPGLTAGQFFTNTYELMAPLSPGSYTLTSDVRAKPVGAESELLMSSGLSISVTEPNDDPVALFVPQPLNAALAPGTPVVFNGSTSFDLDGDIADYRWNLGDGTTLNGAGRSIVEHTYEEAGTYSVSLTVVDDKGAESAPKVTRIRVGEEHRDADNTLLVTIGVATAVALVVGILTNTLFGGGGNDSVSTSSTTTFTQPTSRPVTSTSSQTNTSGGASTATIAQKAEGFIAQMNLPFSGVDNVQAVDFVTESNLLTWQNRLEDQSLVIAMYHSDGLTLVPYPQINAHEKTRVDESLRPFGATSVANLIQKRVKAGDEIMKITWVMENGEEFESFAVISPSGLIKYDTFMTLDP